MKISPAIIAEKLAALRNLAAPNFADAVAAQPRLIELLWFLQWASGQPGGLEKFTADFLATFPDRIGTDAMHRISKTEESYTAVERYEVIDSVPTPSRHSSNTELVRFNWDVRGDDGDFHSSPKPNHAFVNKLNHAWFYDFCREYGRKNLAGRLERFCAEPDFAKLDVFWFHDLPGALLDAMDAHAARAQQSLAQTRVTIEITEALDFAFSEKAMIEIVGDSRFGKTESARTYCAAYPGRARLVRTPCTNDNRSFFAAIAEALGLEVTPKITMPELQRQIEFVLKHAGLLLVFDESAWLYPQSYSSSTAPFRLNYIRSVLLDNGCAVALLTTPQFLDKAASKFERVTGFNLTQWRGRIMRRVELPSELPDDDLLAVVRIQLPELGETAALRIVAAALTSESFLFAVEKVAKNARALARKNGREQISAADIESGIRLAGIALTIAARAPAAPPPDRLGLIRAAQARVVQEAGNRAATPAPGGAVTGREIRPLETETVN